MSSIKTPLIKSILSKRTNTRKKAPIFVFLKTGRKVRDSPQSHKNWKNSRIF